MIVMINTESDIQAICDADFRINNGIEQPFTLLDMEKLAAIRDQESEIKKAAHQGAE